MTINLLEHYSEIVGGDSEGKFSIEIQVCKRR
jgi:hypothetical protein